MARWLPENPAEVAPEGNELSYLLLAVAYRPGRVPVSTMQIPYLRLLLPFLRVAIVFRSSRGERWNCFL